MSRLIRYWYQPSLNLVTFFLLPFSWLFARFVTIRRLFYQWGVFNVEHFTAPVIVVGNIAVGGTGKTPLVIWLAHFLQSHGYRPGIVSRGYGGKHHSQPYWVNATSPVSEVGDEALLLSKNTQMPLVVCADRAAAVRYLLRKSSCNIVISDDGLQHYRMDRMIEIAVVDGQRRFGNAHLLPAGPLRESIARLQEVDFVIVNEGQSENELTMSLGLSHLVSLRQGNAIAVADFPRQRVHAVAGIGHPQRFFTALAQAGFDIIPHAFPDHYLYQAQDMAFPDNLPIIMTEKDAVKCMTFADQRYWYAGITVTISDEFKVKLLAKVKSLEVNNDSEADFIQRACHAAHSKQCDGNGKDGKETGSCQS